MALLDQSLNRTLRVCKIYFLLCFFFEPPTLYLAIGCPNSDHGSRLAHHNVVTNSASSTHECTDSTLYQYLCLCYWLCASDNLAHSHSSFSYPENCFFLTNSRLRVLVMLGDPVIFIFFFISHVLPSLCHYFYLPLFHPKDNENGTKQLTISIIYLRITCSMDTSPRTLLPTSPLLLPMCYKTGNILQCISHCLLYVIL